MPIGFSEVVYYPHINITDDSWLREAILIWDRIQPITPGRDYTEEPIDSRDQAILRERRILEPMYVTAAEVEDLGIDDLVLEYLTDPDADIVQGDDRHAARLHPEKLSPPVRDLLRQFDYARIHPEKLSYLVRSALEERGAVRRPHRSADGEFMHVDSRFAAFYMTLLASALAKRRGLSLATDEVKADSLVGKVISSSRPLRLTSERERDWDRPRRYSVNSQATEVQGILSHIVVRLASPPPDIDIEVLLDFKDRHASELGRLREYIASLVPDFADIESSRELQQRARDILTNRVRPAMADYERALKGFGIRHLVESTAKLSVVSAPPTAAIGALGFTLGLSAPQAILAAASVSLVCTGLLYLEERQRRSRESPLAYVHLMKEGLRRRSRR